VLSTRPTLRLAFAALAVATVLALLLPVTAFAWASNAFSSTSEQQLFQLTNQARAAAGLPALNWDDRLAALARARAQDMIVRDYFSHQIPPDGHTVFDVMSSVGYCFDVAGENIGWNNYPDDQATSEIQAMFMNSPDHRANILGPAWDVVGIGAYKGPDGKMMWSLVFADKCAAAAPAPTPPPSKPKPPVKPTSPPTPDPTPPPTPHPTRTPSPTPSPTPTPTPTPNPTSSPIGTPTPTSTASLEPSPAPSGEVAVAPGRSLRVADPAAPQGLLDSIAAGIAGVFFGN
jgi:uncharacterized protein YkwD